MTIGQVTTVTLARGAVVALLTTVLAGPLRDRLVNAPRWTWGLVLAPLVFPTLLVGYAYANVWPRLVPHPALQEAWYGLLLVMRTAPVAVLVLWMAPEPPISRGALRVHALLKPARGRLAWRWAHAGFWLRGPGRRLLAAAAAVFLLVFSEFELASMAQVGSWCVWVFDAQAGGLPVSDSVQFALRPMLVELAVLIAAIMLLLGGNVKVTGQDNSAGSSGAPSWVLIYGCIATIIVCVFPLAVVLKGTASGLRLLLENFAMTREVMTAIIVAGVAAGMVGLAAALLLRYRQRRPGAGLVVLLAVCVPGLLGPLVLALLILFLFQRPALRWAYDTPAPLLLALVLAWLPLAVVLLSLLHLRSDAAAAHAAALLGRSASGDTRRCARELLWRLRSRPRAAALGLLMLLAYFDLTVSSILAPPGMTTAPVRLYNLMHYGQSAVLSAMIGVTAAAPVAVLLAAIAARRAWDRWMAAYE